MYVPQVLTASFWPAGLLPAHVSSVRATAGLELGQGRRCQSSRSFFFCSLTTLWILTHRKCSGTRSAFRHKGTVPVKSQGSSGGFGRWINQVTTRAAATAARSEHRKCHATDLPPEQCRVEITSLEENKWTDTKRDFLWGCWIEKDLKPKHISMGGTPSTPPCARSRVAGSTDQSQHHGTASPAEPCN